MNVSIKRIAVAFEFATLNGGEHSMLAIVDRLADASVEIVALAPPQGRLAEALHTRGVAHIPFQPRDSGGSRLPRERVCDDLIGAVRRCCPVLLHANSLSIGRLTGAIAGELTVPAVAHLRDILKLSRAAVADLNRNRLLLAVSQAVGKRRLSAPRRAAVGKGREYRVRAEHDQPFCSSGTWRAVAPAGLPRRCVAADERG